MLLANAVIREAQRLWVTCTEARLPLLPDMVSRLRSLMLSVARLSEGELLRRTTDLQVCCFGTRRCLGCCVSAGDAWPKGPSVRHGPARVMLLYQAAPLCCQCSLSLSGGCLVEGELLRRTVMDLHE